MLIRQRLFMSAFTLIELMIAIALGMILVYTAVAGFRVASQSMTIANRLSLENSLIRSGFAIAHDNLDYWTNVDDPDDVSRQRLRGRVAVSGNLATRLADIDVPAQAGLPFAPFSGPNGVFKPNQPVLSGMPINTSSIPRYPLKLKMGTAEAPIYLTEGTAYPLVDQRDDDIGFDPTYAWAPHDPRTWYHGNCIEKYNVGPKYPAPGQLMGRYGVFTNIYESDSLIFHEPKVKKDSLSTEYTATYQATRTPPHRWYPRHLLGLLQGIGYYGLCDYMPSNAIYGLYRSYEQGKTSTGGIPRILTISGNPASHHFVGEGMINIPALGLYALTVTQSYAIVNPYTNGLTDEELAAEHYKFNRSDYSVRNNAGRVEEFREFMRKTTGSENIMTSRPEHWPTVQVGVARYVKSGKFANVARIRWENPMTGQLSELSFTSVATTLRGARMQRHQDQGWAKWDNGPDADSNDPTLDSP